MRDDDLLRTLTMLRFQAHLSHAEHESSSRAFNVTRSFLARGYEEIKEHHRGRLYTYIPDGRIKGYVMHWHQDESWYGPPIQNCALDFDWTDPQAILWATQKLLELQSELGEHCELMLSSRYSSILGVALGAGFQIDSVVLLGRPQESLDRLTHRYAPPDHLGMMNLIVQPLTNRKEVEKIIQLKRTYFTQHPEFCWFGAHDRHLGRHKDELIKAIRQRRQGLTGPIHAWVLHREGEFMGSFSYSEERDNALWGHVAGLDIILHPRIQRKGVVKTAYKIMLESMITQGVTLYKGGTSQPAVMGLGKIMNRPLFSWVLRKNAAFTPSQFKFYLPAKLTELEPSP
jgi:hypothetical protein